MMTKSTQVSDKYFIKYLRILIGIIWLVGLICSFCSISIMFGFYTIDSFPWAPFQTVLTLSVFLLIVTVPFLLNQLKKSKCNTQQLLRTIIKHMTFQMICIVIPAALLFMTF